MARNQNNGRNAGNVNWGICTNTSGYEVDGVQKKCSKCMDKEKQAIRASKDFVCEECGEPLTKCPPPKKPTPWALIIAAAVVVIGGGVGAGLGISNSNKKKAAAREEAMRIEDSIRQVREAEEQRIADSLALANAAADSARQAAIADSLEQVRIADSIAAAEAEKAAKKNAVKSTGSSTGGSNLGWGSYSGPMQNGKPHGVGGTIKVTKSYNIDLKDGRGSTLSVNPGERIENTKFENGRLRAGELHRNDGTRKWFNA